MKLSRRTVSLGLFSVVIGAPALAAADSSKSAEALARNKEPRLSLDHFMVSEVNSNFIVPCIRIRTKLWNRVARNANLGVTVLVTWTSRGESFTQSFTMSLQGFSLTDHHPQPEDTRWRLIEGIIDVTPHAVDGGTLPAGGATFTRLNGDHGHDGEDDDDDHGGDCST